MKFEIENGRNNTFRCNLHDGEQGLEALHTAKKSYNLFLFYQKYPNTLKTKIYLSIQTAGNVLSIYLNYNPDL